MLKIDNVKVYEDLDLEKLKKLVCRKYKIKEEDVIKFNIYKKSIDARDKRDVHYVYSVIISCKDESNYKKYALFKESNLKNKVVCLRKSSLSPVIVGSGPAGLFCALKLIEYGIKPIILERGKDVDERSKDVEEYLRSGTLNENSNVQFGEGGAGTFSDGKLNTGINDGLIKEVLETFVRFGAPEQILYLNKPHIGTDNLVNVVKNIRKFIESKGGKYIFNACFTDFELDENGNVSAAIYNNFEKIYTDTIILAVGHSARDIFELMLKKKVKMEKKNFSVGLRIEHPQVLINKSQYGDITKLNLPPAEYKLVYHGIERTCYSFCMCPGGTVIASASEKGTIVTNGMSTFSRDLENANSALLVNITAEDFDGENILSPVEFQRKLEKDAFVLGGENGFAPAQKVIDFLNDRKTINFGKVKPTYKPGVTPANLNDLFPTFITETIKEAIKYFASKIEGFDMDDAVLTAVETRSSSPIRIVRNSNNLMSASVSGMYPAGEGPGYAGGIMSAAVDGIKVALSIIESK